MSWAPAAYSGVRSSQRDDIWSRWYPAVLLALWVLIPEVRRIVDWQVGFNSLPIINLIPIIALIPLLWAILASKQKRFAGDLIIAVVLWSLSFCYALLVGSLSGSLFGAIYEFTLYGLPLLVGIWLGSMSRPHALRVFGRLSIAALWFAVLTSFYGLYQYVSPPAWDVLWVNNANLVSIGSPEPFALRIFGTMNSPGVYADFIATAILLNLHRLRRSTWWLIPALMMCGIALLLTFDRTAWLELAIGFVVYVFLSPRRAAALSTAAVVSVLTLGVAANLSFITGEASSNSQVVDRISTLSDLQQDESANDRAQQSATALRQALSEPLGQGLGTVGTATKLSAAEATVVLDNGYLERFLEMGIFGVACYLASLVLGLSICVRRLIAAFSADDSLGAALVATSLAVQVALLGAELSGDHHSALMGIVFWALVGLSSTFKTQVAPSIVGGRGLRDISRPNHVHA